MAAVAPSDTTLLQALTNSTRHDANASKPLMQFSPHRERGYSSPTTNGICQRHRAPTISTQWHTGAMAENEDIKERMRQALDAKNKKAASSTPHGTAPTDTSAHEHSDREGGKREFRRKSG